MGGTAERETHYKDKERERSGNAAWLEGEAVICSELYSLDTETSGDYCYTHSESENEQLKTMLALFFSFYTCFRVISSVCMGVCMDVLLFKGPSHFTGLCTNDQYEIGTREELSIRNAQTFHSSGERYISFFLVLHCGLKYFC